MTVGKRGGRPGPIKKLFKDPSNRPGSDNPEPDGKIEARYSGLFGDSAAHFAKLKKDKRNARHRLRLKGYRALDPLDGSNE